MLRPVGASQNVNTRCPSPMSYGSGGPCGTSLGRGGATVEASCRDRRVAGGFPGYHRTSSVRGYILQPLSGAGRNALSQGYRRTASHFTGERCALPRCAIDCFSRLSRRRYFLCNFGLFNHWNFAQRARGRPILSLAILRAPHSAHHSGPDSRVRGDGCWRSIVDVSRRSSGVLDRPHERSGVRRKHPFLPVDHVLFSAGRIAAASPPMVTVGRGAVLRFIPIHRVDWIPHETIDAALDRHRRDVAGGLCIRTSRPSKRRLLPASVSRMGANAWRGSRGDVVDARSANCPSGTFSSANRPRRR